MGFFTEASEAAIENYRIDLYPTWSIADPYVSLAEFGAHLKFACAQTPTFLLYMLGSALDSIINFLQTIYFLALLDKVRPLRYFRELLRNFGIATTLLGLTIVSTPLALYVCMLHIYITLVYLVVKKFKPDHQTPRERMADYRKRITHLNLLVLYHEMIMLEKDSSHPMIVEWLNFDIHQNSALEQIEQDQLAHRNELDRIIKKLSKLCKMLDEPTSKPSSSNESSESKLSSSNESSESKLSSSDESSESKLSSSDEFSESKLSSSDESSESKLSSSDESSESKPSSSDESSESKLSSSDESSESKLSSSDDEPSEGCERHKAKQLLNSVKKLNPHTSNRESCFDLSIRMRTLLGDISLLPNHDNLPLDLQIAWLEKVMDQYAHQYTLYMEATVLCLEEASLDIATSKRALHDLVMEVEDLENKMRADGIMSKFEEDISESSYRPGFFPLEKIELFSKPSAASSRYKLSL